MAEELKDDYPGATRGLFATIGFILLFIGGDMIAEKEGLRVGLGLFLVLLGVACSYAAAFWQSAKKILSAEAQHAIGNFAHSRNTWRHVIVVIFLMLIFSRFIEGHRWPFSYPADPSVLAENSSLKSKLSNRDNRIAVLESEARNWRFSYRLRNTAKSSNGNRLTCRYHLVLSKGNNAFAYWQFLQGMLDLAGWEPISSETPAVELRGISMLTASDQGDAYACATALGRALGDAFPNPPVSLKPNQVTRCGDECVELDIGN